MAGTPPKRRREDISGYIQIDTTKRHKNTYINEQETTQDLQDFFTILYTDSFLDVTKQPESDPDNNPTQDIKHELEEGNDEKESFIRHLLEASDDELGIPAVDGVGDSGDGGGGDEIAGPGYRDYLLDLCDGLWELEDEAANYYTLLQSELFMQ
ncbi:uncharacterized protein [Rutidosis leptorrhynchoides]|uniref:uncharacterized protein n=1 Tax=Rutidosis leptorrhynchoides TaxID=125765 RepID=UPI003A98DDC9